MPWGSLVVGLAGAAASATARHDEQQAAGGLNAQQLRAMKMGIRWRVNDARKAGINPLYALGAPTTMPHFINPGGDSGWMQQAGQDLGDLVGKALDKEGKYVRRLHIKQEEEKLKQMGLTTQALKNEVEKNAQQPVQPAPDDKAGIVPGQNDVAKYVPPIIQKSQSQGVEAGTNPMRKQYLDIDGTIIRPPNDQLSESMEDNEALKWRIKIQDTKNILVGQYGAYYFRNPKAIQFLKNTRPKNLGKGYEARWNPDTMAWQRVKIGKEGSKLFTRDFYKPKRKTSDYLRFSGNGGF